jgi:AcrR family transcriptional regulator
MNTHIAQSAEIAAAGGPEGAIAPGERLSARAKLLAAAGELFYEEGVQSVGIEKVIERAGVAKATLYGNFKGKDDLVRAYLEERHAVRQANILARQAQADDPRGKLLAIFDALDDSLARPGYRGCAFVRASAEMRPESAGRAVCENARKWTRELFAGLAREAGARDPELLAHQLVLLYDGASVSAQMDQDRAGARAARAVAAQMVDAACGKLPA